MSNDNEYMRVYMLERWRKRRAVAIEFLGGWCVTCGTDEDLQFDHIFPHTKSYNISSVPSASESRFWREIVKCQLLCGPCHRAKTSVENSVPHGGGKAGKRNCMCDPCRARRSEYMKARRLSLRS